MLPGYLETTAPIDDNSVCEGTACAPCRAAPLCSDVMPYDTFGGRNTSQTHVPTAYQEVCDGDVAGVESFRGGHRRRRWRRWHGLGGWGSRYPWGWGGYYPRTVVRVVERPGPDLFWPIALVGAVGVALLLRK